MIWPMCPPTLTSPNHISQAARSSSHIISAISPLYLPGGQIIFDALLRLSDTADIEASFPSPLPLPLTLTPTLSLAGIEATKQIG